MLHSIRLPDGCHADLDYFVEWRPYLWARPVAEALEFLGDLRGKRVLEVGGRYGKMTSLFVLLGAHLADSGKAAFVENVRGGAVWQWLRFGLFHRRRNYEVHGIRPDQLLLFAERFDDLQVCRCLGIVYTILGRKKPSQGVAHR